jgi:hypothetical protein
MDRCTAGITRNRNVKGRNHCSQCIRNMHHTRGTYGATSIILPRAALEVHIEGVRVIETCITVGAVIPTSTGAVFLPLVGVVASILTLVGVLAWLAWHTNQKPANMSAPARLEQMRMKGVGGVEAAATIRAEIPHHTFHIDRSRAFHQLVNDSPLIGVRSSHVDPYSMLPP